VAEIPSALAQDDGDGPKSTIRLAVSGEIAEPRPREWDSLDHRAFWRAVEMIAAIIPLDRG
jgi:hypothetical protein